MLSIFIKSLNLFRTKMAPPSYADLGKSARDVFGKGFHFGLVKLDVKSKTSSGIELNSGGQSNVDAGKVEERYVVVKADFMRKHSGFW